MATKSRRTLVQLSHTFNGIDFVEVANDAQTELRVHFLNDLSLAYTLDSPYVTITGGESIPTVSVNPIDDSKDWYQDGDHLHLVLHLHVVAPGDFSNYTLEIYQKQSLASGSPRLDPFLSTSVFSFKARCPSDLDCQAAPVVCPPEPSDAPPIDYLSKDFLSFRQALLDFSALRYPEWQERSEADFGVMFLEALCAVADDLSYTQDRIAAEASLPNATQRRSVVRMARLVDYEPTPALAATVMLQFNVAPDTKTLVDGLAVSAPGPDGTPIPFETGATLMNRLVDPNTGLKRTSPPVQKVNPAWNRGAIIPYWLDDSLRCLPVGSVQMYVLGHGYNFMAGQPLLIETAPPTSADPPIRQLVQLSAAGEETCDPLYPPPKNVSIPPGVILHCGYSPEGTAITLIQWSAPYALETDCDLSQTTLSGNLIAATQGQTQPVESFYIPPPPQGQTSGVPAIVRTGPNDTPATPSLQYLYTLRFAPMAWIQPADPTQLPQPEIVLNGPDPGTRNVEVWTFLRWLLDAEQFVPVFTVDAARYSQIPGTLGSASQYDYDGDAGDTLRFGDGVFGAIPEPGANFCATYRSVLGSSGNVAADSITSIDTETAKGVVSSVTNPWPASGGANAEPLETIRRLAPQAFRAVQYRAVLAADYAAAAETLPWVERAGTVFRWTGSWLTVFTTPEPRATEQIDPVDRESLIELLNRYRMAGYESYVPNPDYVSIDLMVQVCALPTAFQGDVEQALLTALSSTPGGFFAHANFTFGQPLEKSALEAAVQNANGVAGVTCLRYRIRGRTLGYTPMGDTVTVGLAQIIRCDNDPSLPGNGSLQIIVEGGK